MGGARVVDRKASGLGIVNLLGSRGGPGPEQDLPAGGRCLMMLGWQERARTADWLIG